MYGMEKTTVYLTTEQRAALGRTAAAEGWSQARLIRAGIDAVTGRHRTGEAASALADVGPGAPPLAPTPTRPRWIDRDAFIGLIARAQADAGLRAELRDLAPDTTDDEPLP